MKSLWFSYVVSLVCLMTLFIGGYWFFYPERMEKIYLASPLPAAFSLLSNKQVTSLAVWKPNKSVLGASTEALPISARSALAYDLTTNQVVYAKQADQTLPMASLTKVMTAIIALEHPLKNDIYTVHTADLVGEDSMGLDAGEKLSLQELLYGLMLPSGNDAAEVLASHFPGGRNAFVNAMNEKAQALGLINTHFPNPTGLQGDGEQYTTVYDLLVLTRYALTNFPLFTEIVATVDMTIPQTSTHKEFYLENTTNLLTSYTGVKGVKTGFTPEAGYCLLTYLDYEGHKIIAAVLGSEDRRADMKLVLDHSLRKLNLNPPVHE